MIEVKREIVKTDEAWKRLYVRLEKENLLFSRLDGEWTSRRLSLRRALAAVAIIMLILGTVLWMLPISDSCVQNFVTQENREKATLVKTLEDGSVVYLARESSICYPEHFTADKREINLQGEAFFDVAGKPEQTFIVETGKVRVEVLGTAFDVRNKKDTPFSLSVRHGKVKVFLKGNGQLVYAKAGETVILQNEKLALRNTGYSGYFSRYTQNVRFKDEYLENVLRVINKESSGWQIETASPSLNKKRLTVEFSDNSPETVAELISLTFNLKCTRRDNKLILSE